MWQGVFQLVVVLWVSLCITGTDAHKITYVSAIPTLSSNNQFLVVAEELRRQGHEVTFAINKLASSRVETARFPIHSFPAPPGGAPPWAPLVQEVTSLDIFDGELLQVAKYTKGNNDLLDVLTTIGYEQSLRAALETMQKPPFSDASVLVIDMFNQAYLDAAAHLGRPYIIWYVTALGGYRSESDASSAPDGFIGTSVRQHQSVYFQLLKVATNLYTQWRETARFQQTSAVRHAVGLRASLDSWTHAPKLCTWVLGLEVARPLSPLMRVVGMMSRRDASLQPHSEISQWIDSESAAHSSPVVYVAFGSEALFSGPTMDNIGRGIQELVRSGRVRVLLALRPALRAAFQEARVALPPQGDAFRAEAWVDQPAVLSHPAVKVFVSHCGQASVAEALAARVPIVAVPVFADQPTNALRVQESGMGIRLNRHRMTARQMADSVERILGEASFQRAVDRLHAINWNSVSSPESRAAQVILTSAELQGDLRHLVPPPDHLLANEAVLLVTCVGLTTLLLLSCVKRCVGL